MDAWCLELLGSRKPVSRARPATAGPSAADRAVGVVAPVATRRRPRRAARARDARGPRGGYAMEMDFGFLYDESRSLFAIGYQAGSPTLDDSFYDLLASEARLASFIAIAKDDVPVEHWFRLGRSLTRAAGATALVSWSGSMFEYLMPALVMRSFPFTLLDQTYRRRGAAPDRLRRGARRAVGHQRERVQRARPPPDLSVPRVRRARPRAQARLGARPRRRAVRDGARGAGRRRSARSRNLARARARGRARAATASTTRSTTRARDPGERVRRSCDLHGAPRRHEPRRARQRARPTSVWQRRFHADPLVRSAELLLDERVPRRSCSGAAGEPTPTRRCPTGARAARGARGRRRRTRRSRTSRCSATCRTRHGHQLRRRATAATRSSRSRAGAPTRRGTTPASAATCRISTTGASGRRRISRCARRPTRTARRSPPTASRSPRATATIETRTEIAVVPDDAAEVRRVTLTNHSARAARDRADELRRGRARAAGRRSRAPGVPESVRRDRVARLVHGASLATRRPRSATEPPLWCAHVVARGRERVGRGRPARPTARGSSDAGARRATRARWTPAARSPGPSAPCSIPIFALRARVRLEPGGIRVGRVHDARRRHARAARSSWPTATTIRAPRSARSTSRGPRRRWSCATWTSRRPTRRVFQELAGHLFYPIARSARRRSELRAQPRLAAAAVGATASRATGRSCSRRSTRRTGLPTLRQLLAAHHYWRRRRA